MRFLILAVALPMIMPVSGFADDRVPLNKDPVLENGLRIMAQGYWMRKNCDEVSLRLFRSMGLVNSLKARGRELGYSDEELRAYLDDKEEQARVEVLARAEMESFGLDFDDPSTFCVVAKAKVKEGKGFGRYFR